LIAATKQESISSRGEAETAESNLTKLLEEVKSHVGNIALRDTRIADLEARNKGLSCENTKKDAKIKSLEEIVGKMKASINTHSSIKAQLVRENQESAKSTELAIGKIESEMKEMKQVIEQFQRANAGLEFDASQNRHVLSQIGDLFYESMLSENVGISLLLNTGKMASLPYVLNAWKGCPYFDGQPSFPLKCASTSSMTSIIHNQAVYDFTAKIASILTLDTAFPSYLRYSLHPITMTGTCHWVNYNMYDQLTIMARLIFMFNNPNSKFIATTSDGHVVTATTNVNIYTERTDITLALTIISVEGVANKHHIDLADIPFSLDAYITAKFVPDAFNIVGEI
jgi:hypothetical protein